MNYIKEQIEKFETIIIHGHIRPDGDCYGSQLGLKDIILSTYPSKKVYAVGETNPKFEFLGKMDLITDQVYKKSLVFVVDCGQSNVISDCRYKLGKVIIHIDHHLLIETIGNYQWVDSSFSSCSEMIYHLKEKLNLKLSPQGAIPIYVGMATDTGSFSFDRVNSETFRIISQLLKDYNFNVADINQKINETKINLLKFKGYVCNNFQAEQGLIYIKISDDILKELDLDIKEVFEQISILSNIEGFPVWAFIKQLNPNEWKISIRSSGPRISHIARNFGGGGHERACGMTVFSEEQINQVLSLIKESIYQFNN
ncbi:MAG: bifunctional oligoribonuclease/PAP phosphatase NrnA [Vigna little leaf phytoplasma]|nr:bifunctional oligoribonuclease/PAP phosphatase NrnA [Vigna little leaf phytoplasma]